MFNKPLKYIDSKAKFDTLKISTSELNAGYTIGDSSEQIGTPDILWENICFIEDEHLIWTHGIFYNKDEYERLDVVEEKVEEHEQEIKSFKDVYAATVAMIMNKITSNTQQETDLEDLVLANTMILQDQISENRDDLDTLDKTVSYSLASHEQSINTLDKLVSYSISDHEKSIKTLDEIVSYSLNKHEERLNEQEYTIGFALNDLHNDVVTLDTMVSYSLSTHEQSINTLDTVIAYSLNEHENELNTLDKAVAYSLTDHEERIKSIEDISTVNDMILFDDVSKNTEEIQSVKSTLFANTGIILDKINDLSLLNEDELNYITE